MFHVVLYEPEIPANTGNIGRTCVATGATLHLVGRMGFHIDDRSVRRAGLDYWSEVKLVRHDTFQAFEQSHLPGRIFLLSAHGSRPYTRGEFQVGDALVFGSESRGLPGEILARHTDRTLTIPQPTGKVRSLNLATAAGIVLYEAMRQVNAW